MQKKKINPLGDMALEVLETFIVRETMEMLKTTLQSNSELFQVRIKNWNNLVPT